MAEPTAPSSAMPDEYDRLYAALDGLPDVVQTQSATIHVVPPFGVGGSTMYSVRTVRQRDVHVNKKGDEIGRGRDTVFLIVVGAGAIATRLALPPAVCDAIARQRDALTARTRSKIARASAEARKARGEVPGFMRGRKARKAKP